MNKLAVIHIPIKQTKLTYTSTSSASDTSQISHKRSLASTTYTLLKRSKFYDSNSSIVEWYLFATPWPKHLNSVTRLQQYPLIWGKEVRSQSKKGG
ncbi:hypothetical protein ACQJ21_14650 [Klebsiella michiganensis]|uniref:hypothetical protein n=1 Tax=Klebsiella michiganensis TaxID=1134687 RepID=UPI002DB8B569|nr:hypothetical protein [Klebsiella michiganensis]MEB8288966.1 hypothetical protein [Klebsiella michiganensis]